MPEDVDVHRAILGARWLGSGQVVVQALRSFVYVGLAYFLAPSAFGLVAMAVVITNFLDIFRDFGTRTAIVQRREVDQRFLSSIFYLNVAIGAALTIGVLVTSPLIAAAYGDPDVVPVLRGMSLSILFSSWGLVHLALLHRRMQFGKFAATQLLNAVTHGSVSLTLAALGFGVWALVAGVVTSYLAATVSAWSLARWRPSLAFSGSDIRSILGFSSHLSGSQLLAFLMHNADKFIIGRVLGAFPLGLYNLAQRLVAYPAIAITQVVHNVLLPSLSQRQDDDEGMRRALLRSCCVICFVVFPVMGGLAVVSQHLVGALLGPEWLGAVIVIAILAPVWAVLAVSDTILLVYKAKGRTDLLLRWNALSGSLMVAGYFAGLPWGLKGVAVAYGLVALVLSPLAVIVPFRLIGLRNAVFYRTLVPFFGANLLMVSVVVLVQIVSRSYFSSDVTILLSSVLVGVVTYGAIALVWRPEALTDVLAVVGLNGLARRFG